MKLENKNTATACEVPVQSEAVFVTRQCRGRGLRIMVNPDGVTQRVMCARHSLWAYPSGWLVDWSATEEAFGKKVRS